MKVEVLNNFYDTQTETLHTKGEIIEVTEKRAAQIMTVLSGYIVEVKDTEPDFSGMTKKELLEILSSKNIQTNPRMSKADLIELME